MPRKYHLEVTYHESEGARERLLLTRHREYGRDLRVRRLVPLLVQRTRQLQGKCNVDFKENKTRLIIESVLERL